VACLFAVRTATQQSESLVRRLRSVESLTQSLRESSAEQLQTVADLANRLKMIRVRSALSHAERKTDAEELPDPYKEPDKWRTMANRRLSEQRLGSKS